MTTDQAYRAFKAMVEYRQKEAHAFSAVYSGKDHSGRRMRAGIKWGDKADEEETKLHNFFAERLTHNL